MKDKIDLTLIKDENGSLLPIEFSALEFVPKRVFTVSNVPKGEIRGQHAHFETEQFLVCVNGVILVGLDDGNILTETTIYAGQGIYVPKMVWDWQKFKTGNEYMIVLASTNYDKKDYIEDKKTFLKLLNEKSPRDVL